MRTDLLCCKFSGIVMAFALAGIPGIAMAEEVNLDGRWVVNYELSDDTDIQVEKAIKAAGGRIRDTGKKGRGRYKGGPPEQELYDHLSYDEVLVIRRDKPRFLFSYDEGFEREFFSDNRGRSVSASSLQSGERHDYAFAYWDNGKLVVEARPRDGGKTHETYHLDPATGQLNVELELRPLTFLQPVQIRRVYDRMQDDK